MSAKIHNSHYTTTPNLKHTKLVNFEREHFYTRSQTKQLAKNGIVSLIRIKGKFYIAINPEYAHIDPKQLYDHI